MTVIKSTRQEAGRRKLLQLGRSRRYRIDHRPKITSSLRRRETSKETRCLLRENDCQGVRERRKACIRKLEGRGGELSENWAQSPVVSALRPGNGKPDATKSIFWIHESLEGSAREIAIHIHIRL